jgi:hypothetical protein
MPVLTAQELISTDTEARRTVRVTRDTPVELLTVDTIDSSHVAIGDTIHLALKNDLEADGVVVARAGTAVTSRVTKVRRKDAMHDGNVRLGQMELALSGVQRIELRGGDTAAEDWDDTWAFVVGEVILFPLTLFARLGRAIHAPKSKSHASDPPQSSTRELHMGPGEALHTSVARTVDLHVEYPGPDSPKAAESRLDEH